jgi:hypothetical protein
MADGNSQQLYGSNISGNIGEEQGARIKDPLWFLSRQWQSGEFEAENGGRVAYLTISAREDPLQTVKLGADSKPVERDSPLDALIESEASNGDAPAWQAEALEYAFEAETAGQRLVGRDYVGRALDWYNFDVAGAKQATAPEPTPRQMTPTQIYFPGIPNPRWWRFEDGNASFDEPVDPEPNTLSMLLPEFFYADINNWYVLPLPMTAGTIREVTDVAVVDSFGVVTNLGPADQTTKSWRVFALDGAEGTNAKALGGQFLFAPNIALDVLYNDELEDVRFIRDEDANLVWAVEFRYRTAAGETIINGDGQRSGPDSQGAGDGLPRFRLKSDLPAHWIPYVPRKNAPNSALSGEMHLRRARSNEAATPANPQYRSKIVAESVRLNEEEIPRSGLRVRRIARYARGSDGTQHFWVGRLKESGQRTTLPGLKFDFIEE